MREGPRPKMAYPDYAQSVALHRELMQRLRVEEYEEPNEQLLKNALSRAERMGERGDIVAYTSALMFELVRGKPFGERRSAQTGMAITLAFLARHGIGLNVPNEEIVGVAYAIESGQVYVGMLEMWLRNSLGSIR
jgi:prophage maintenance system killer protein